MLRQFGVTFSEYLKRFINVPSQPHEKISRE